MWALAERSFRNFYRDFLKEAYEWTGHSAIKIAYEIVKDSAKNWSRLVLLFEKLEKQVIYSMF